MGMIDGKVAVVTGAGQGIGREIALSMARAGAQVVVNDLGCSEYGEGNDPSVAQKVVDEIKNEGGEAAANTDSVASWQGAHQIIQTALDHFGRIDILVNNAGIIRNRICYKISREEWEDIQRVHLKGTFCCTRAAAPYMRKQKQGRLIHFTSTSGLIGTIGHTNYGTAKMAIAGLSRNVAIEMKHFKVTSNCIAPFAWSRMVASVPTKTEEAQKEVDRLKNVKAADVAPLAVYLASESSKNISGQIFGVRGKEIYLFSQPRIERSMHNSEGWTVGDIEKHLEPTLMNHFTPLETSAEYFSWEPMT